MNFNNYDVKLGSWYQGSVQYAMERSLSYLSPVLWKTLDNDFKLCNVLTEFKKRVKLWKGPTCVTVASVPNAEYQTDNHD